MKKLFVLGSVTVIMAAGIFIAHAQTSPALETIVRLYSASRGKHWLTTGKAGGTAPAGFDSELKWKILTDKSEVNDTLILYSCETNNHTFASTEPNCEGQILREKLGWIYAPYMHTLPLKKDGLAPLYRCYIHASGDHFVSESNTCENAKVEKLLGYVYPATAETAFVEPAPASIQVLSPNGGEYLKTGSTYPIKWNSTNFPATENVRIELRYVHNDPTYKAGRTFEAWIVEKTPNNGVYEWTIPEEYGKGISPSSFQIKISSLGAQKVIDYSDDYFTIQLGVSNPRLTVSSPVQGARYKSGDNVPVEWSPKNNTGIGFNLLSNNDTSFLRIIFGDTAGQNNWTIKIPDNIPAGNYYVRVKNGLEYNDIGYSGIFSINSSENNINNDNLKIISPHAGNPAIIGLTHRILWSGWNYDRMGNKITKYSVYLLTGLTSSKYLGEVNMNNQDWFEWKVSSDITPASDYRIQFSGPDVSVSESERFSIINNPNQPGDIDPNGGSTFQCLMLKNDLRRRSTDAQTNGEVSALQDFLQAYGMLNSEPTGYFGGLTFEAVKQFQKQNSINSTGFVGPITRGIISNYTCKG